MGNLRGYEWLILLLIVVLLFGAKRLPETARGLGRSLRILKAETKGLRDDDDTVADETVVRAQQVPVAPRPIAPVAAAPASSAAPVTSTPVTSTPVTSTPVSTVTRVSTPQPSSDALER